VCLGDGLVARWRCLRAGHERTGLTVCSAISEGLLPAGVVLPAVLVALVAPAPLAGAGSVPQLPALSVEAVVLPTVVTEADLERPAAVETHDLDEIDQVRVVGHDAGEADLDNERPEWEALCVTHESHPARRRLPGRSVRSDRAPSASLAKGYLPVPLPTPNGAAYDFPSPLGISFTTLTRGLRAATGVADTTRCRCSVGWRPAYRHRGSTP